MIRDVSLNNDRLGFYVKWFSTLLPNGKGVSGFGEEVLNLNVLQKLDLDAANAPKSIVWA